MNTNYYVAGWFVQLQYNSGIWWDRKSHRDAYTHAHQVNIESESEPFMCVDFRQQVTISRNCGNEGQKHVHMNAYIGNLYWFHILYGALMYNSPKPYTHTHTLRTCHEHGSTTNATTIFEFHFPHTQNFYLIINRREWLCLWSKLLKNEIHYYHSYQFHFMCSTPVTFSTFCSCLLCLVLELLLLVLLLWCHWFVVVCYGCFCFGCCTFIFFCIFDDFEWNQQ